MLDGGSDSCKTDICETTAGTKSYSGYVHIPGDLVGNLGGYDMNVYFMYFEARNNPQTAPVAVYLAGGPGEASSYAAMNSENGPCVVNHEGTNTTINPWSFNNHANMLYIDQPIQVGFSYSSLINGTYSSTSLAVTPNNGTSTPPLPGQGIFADQSVSSTANTTVASARGLWAFSEHWFSSFPGYDTLSTDISIWGNSYGGMYVPEFAATVSKGLKQLPACHPLKERGLKVDAIGITNGCIDFYYQIEGFPEFANNNTYGVKFYNETFYQEMRNRISKPGGCLDLTEQCRQAGQTGDPDYTGSNATVNQMCIDATLYCASIITPLYTIHNVSETSPLPFAKRHVSSILIDHIPAGFVLRHCHPNSRDLCPVPDGGRIPEQTQCPVGSRCPSQLDVVLSRGGLRFRRNG